MLALFDLDDTLIDRTAAFERWVNGFVSAHKLDPGDAEWLVIADDRGTAPRDAFSEKVRARFGLAPPVAALVDEYFDAIVDMHEPDPRVIGSLEVLRAEGWKVGVVTNGSTRWQREKLRTSGLLAHLDGYCISEEVRARKPDRRIFEEAARRCGAPLGGWMVGDDPVNDIGGGLGAGLRTAWMSRGRTWPEGVISPHAHVAHLVDAVAVIVTDGARIGVSGAKTR